MYKNSSQATSMNVSAYIFRVNGRIVIIEKTEDSYGYPIRGEKIAISNFRTITIVPFTWYM